MSKSVLKEKSFLFALRVIKLYKYLCEKKRICFEQTVIAFRNFSWGKYKGGSQYNNYFKKQPINYNS
jgi:hypothetical protein